MKLSSILMATATTSGMTPMEKMQSISLAHSSIRNGFNRPQFDAYRKKHEELFKEITQKGMRSDPEFVMAQAANLTVTFRSEPEGIAIGQFPSLDGSNNDLTGQLRGKVGDRYSRLVPPDYCPWDENSDSVSDLDGEPRCITHLGFEKRKLPNERALSLAITELNGNQGKTTEDNKNSMIGPLWGQFVTHDIIQTPDMGNGQTKCDCSAIAECKNIEVDRLTDPHFDDIDCMFVIRSAPHVPSQGNFVREQMNQKTSFLDLSQVYGASEEDLLNLIATDKMHLKTRTGVDGAPTAGSNDGSGRTGDILPFTSDAKSATFADKFKQPSTFNDDNFKDFIAGDTRVEENPYLASFHTIFVRYHNLIVDGLKKQRPDWSKRDVFENARMITISVFKNIHYGQAIEAMLGERMSVVAKLKFVDQSGSRKRAPKNTRSEITPLEWELGKRPHNEEQRRPSRAFYRQHKEQEEHNNMRGMQSRVTGHESPHEQEPSIRNEFATAGYRMHGQVSALMKAMNDEWNLIKHQHSDEWHADDDSTDPNEEGLLPGEKDLLSGTPGLGKMKYNFFDPEWVHTKGPGGCLRGAMKSNQLKMDGTFDKDLQHFLFKPDNWHHGVDLFAINIARGREHGIGSYGALKSFCKEHSIYRKFYTKKMNDANLFINLNQVQAIRDMYISKADAAKAGKTQDDFVDLYVGMQLETHMEDATVGPTAGCIIAEQFVALKTGDRFWFENQGVMTVDQMKEIRKMGLGSLSCATFEGAGKESLMAINPWKASGDTEGEENNLKRCKDFPQVDLSKWAKPKSDDETEMEKEPVVVACVWVTKAKAVDCSNLNWTDDDLTAYTETVQKTKKFPVLGKNSVIKFIAKAQVKRISLAGNNISSVSLIENLASTVKNTLLEISFAKNPGASADSRAGVLEKFADYQKLGHLDVGDTAIDCVPVNVLTRLTQNLENWNRLIFLNSNEIMNGRKI